MFRKIGKSKIGILLAILFGISLLFFRGGSKYSNIFNSDNFVADVSGTKISTTKFNRTLNMNINQFSQLIGTKITKNEIRDFQIAALALNALISDAIFENEYDKKKFKLDKKIIALKTKERIPDLYEGNILNEAKLNEFLQSQQLKIEDIVQIINFETRNNFFDDAFFKIHYPNEFTKKINNYDEHSRIIDHIKFSLDDFIPKMDYEVNDSNIKDYYSNNINLYMSEEKRDVEYLIIDKNKLSINFEPNEFEVSNYYNDNKDLFFEDEKRSFLQFNFKEYNDAQKFRENIDNFKTAEEIENYANNKNVEYNFFENLSSKDLLNAISKTLFNLKTNQKSEIIETSLAKHIIVLKNIKKESQLYLDDVREDIFNKLKNVELDNFYESLKQEIGQNILNGSIISEIASNIEYQDLKLINGLSKNLSNYDDNEKDFYSSLISNSFSANKDYVSDIIELDNDSFYIFNVLNVYEKEPLEFESIKLDIENDYKLSKKIEEIKQILKENKNNSEFINLQSKLYNKEIEVYTLDNRSNYLPQVLVNKIFINKKNDNIFHIENNNVHFVKINKIIIPNNDSDKNKISLISGLKGSFQNELMKNIKISTNDNLLEAIIDRY